MAQTERADSRHWNVSATIALIGILPALLTAYIGYSQGKSSTVAERTKSELHALSLREEDNPNFRRLTYPNYGISLLAPKSWTVEDGPAEMAGGEFNLVKRYEETKGAIGINFRLRPIQDNYISDVASQIANQIDVFKRMDPDAMVEDAVISGRTGKLFKYKTSTGQRTMDVRIYWIRLAPTVQLQIMAAQYDDAADKVEFWRQSDSIIESIAVAFDSWEERYKKAKER